MKTRRDLPWGLKLISSVLAGLMALPGNAVFTVLAADSVAIQSAEYRATDQVATPQPLPPPGSSAPPVLAPAPVSRMVGPALQLLSAGAVGLAPDAESEAGGAASGIPPGPGLPARRGVALASGDPVPGNDPSGSVQILDVDFDLIGSGQAAVTIRYEVVPSRQYVVEYRDEFSAPDFCEPWRQLPKAPHNTGEITDVNGQPNRFYRVRAIESPQVGLFALLAHDTGIRADDGITSDLAVTGEVNLSGAGFALWASLDDPAGDYFPVLEEVAAPQHFHLANQDVYTLAGGSLGDGPHTLYFVLTDESGETVATTQIAFTLDTSPPAVSAYLDPTTDSLPVGDGQTELRWIRLAGHTEPGALLILEPGGLWTIADPAGNYVFDLVELALGANQFSVRAFDAACVEGTVGLSLVRREPSVQFPFDNNLAGWEQRISTPRTGTPGSIVAQDGEVIMTEGGSFEVALERDLVIPAGAGMLYLAYQVPSFDSTAVHRMNDAFEVALVDAEGRPLTYTIQAAAGVLPAGQSQPPALPASATACFNHTQGMDPFAAPGVEVRRRNLGGYTLRADITHLAANSHARLILRLVNNDFDLASFVEIQALRFVPDRGPFDFPGSPPPAFSPVAAPTNLGAVFASPGTGGDSKPTEVRFSAPPHSLQGATPAGPGSWLAPVKFIDRDFLESDWTDRFIIFEDPFVAGPAPRKSSGSAMRILNGGLPGSFRRHVYDSIRGDMVNPVALNTHAVYSPRTSGAIGTIDFEADFQWPPDGVSGSTAWHLVVEQGGTLYYSVPMKLFYGPSSWKHYANRGLAESEFDTNPWAFHSGIKPDGMRPDFSEQGAPLRFGYAFGNRMTSGQGYGSTRGIDNWTVTVTPRDIYGPPRLFIEAPSDNATRSAGKNLMSGFSFAGQKPPGLPDQGPNRIVQVAVDGDPVQALDVAGNFFSTLTVAPGRNVFEVTATDAYGQTTTEALTVYGVIGPVQASRSEAVSAGVQPLYGRTSFNDLTTGLYADVALHNVGSYAIAAPLLVGVRNISEATVQVLGADGVSVEGIPYYDFSAALRGQMLAPEEVTLSRAFVFHNPNHAQFTYELVVLGRLNQPPRFTSIPAFEGIIGKVYRYTFSAVDPDGDPLAYSLPVGPEGMTLNATELTLDYVPDTDAIGNHDIRILADDGHGGMTEQRYLLTVTAPSANRPPYFTSEPPTLATVSSHYGYHAIALDPDGDSLSYSLQASPEGMTIDAASGEVEWDPGYEQIGTRDVTVQVDDGRGGLTGQTWRILVLSATDNHAPIFLSSPCTWVVPGSAFKYSITAIDPDSDSITYSLLAGPPGMTVGSADGHILWDTTEHPPAQWPVAAIVRASDGRGGVENQVFELNPVAGAAASIGGVVYHDLNGNGSRELGSVSTATTSGNGDMWLAGMPDGTRASGTDTAPASSPALARSLSLQPGTSLTFEASGGVANGPAIPIQPPDGGAWTPHRDGPQHGISDIVAPVNSALGVFLGAAQPDGTPAPPRLDFRSNSSVPGGLNYTTLSPLLKQVFFIGDGVTDTGERQRVIVPEGATRLYLGTMDGYEWTNNYGNLTIRVFSETEEPGIADQLVFADLDRNGRLGPCEPSTRTQSDGSYVLSSLPPDNYWLRAIASGGWTPLNPANATLAIDVLDGDQVANADFGFFNDPSEKPQRPPVFVSAPAEVVAAGQLWSYQAWALDPDGDPVWYDLVGSPDGMVIDTTAAVVGWRPRTDQIGTHDVILRASDGRGGVALQSWEITVVAPNTAPVITSLPPGPAVVDLPYRYAIRAQDAENQELTFELAETPPAGMTLAALPSAPNAALLAWTPALNQAGRHSMAIVVRDGAGGEGRQEFDLEVVASAPNRAPVFLTQPRTTTGLGLPYAYRARVQDADGDPLAFGWVTAPEGMTINPQLSTPDSALIEWTPTGSQLGSHPVKLTVSDGRTDGVVTQEFSIFVANTLDNSAPVVVSTPPTAATLDQPYQYDLVAEDPDHDAVTWRLAESPRGMSLDPVLGTVRWTPDVAQLGSHTVKVSATDPYLASGSQTWEIEVVAVNRPPQITSVPPVSAQTGELYLYAPRASDPDGDRLSWAFAGPIPDGMTIDAAIGLVRWTPAASQTGVHVIRVRVEDGQGGSDVQQYSLNAADHKANHPPVIVSVAPLFAGAERPYAYRVRATDVDGDVLTLQFLAQPDGATLEPISAANGVAEALVRWTPTPAQVGTHEFILSARDPAGAGAGQRFGVRVRANESPFISSTPRTNGTPDIVYRYDVVATDAEGDALTYGLAEAPAGMQIDTFGRIVWTPQASETGEHPVSVVVADAYGAETTQAFILNVAADTEPPLVELAIAYNLVDEQGNRYVRIGTSPGISVMASDNVGVAERRLLVGDQPVLLGQDGSALVSFPTSGRFEAVAEATDLSGNTGRATAEVNVVDPSASSSVAIVIHSPTNITEVTKPIDIVASMASDVELAEYVVDYAELTSEVADFETALTNPKLDFQVLNRVTLPRNTRQLTEVTVGRFDPTLLLNGMYVIRVTAYDINRKGQQEGVGVNVTGDLKFGEFRLEFTDLSIPVAGIPVTIARVYDSRESRRKGDFGYGWRLAVKDARILEVGKRSGYGFAGDQETFTTATRVYLNTPDGRRVGFTFKPKIPAGSGFLGYPPGYSLLFGQTYDPAFVADPGVYDKLEPLPIPSNGGFVINGDGTFTVVMFGFLGYDPSGYRLTTKDNMVYEYDEDFGLQRVTDPSGNRLQFTSAGISHYSAGATAADQRVTFERDPLGRISQIIDPAGNVLNYSYDHAGDLRAFTDQGANTTEYGYHTLRPHYLETITDPLGREVVRSDYDEDGRLKAITDAAGNRVEQDFDFDQNVGTFTDGRGAVTYSKYDDRGNEVLKWLPGYYTNRFEYDANNNQTNSVDGRGFVTARSYDARGNVTNIVDALGNVTAIAYNGLNKPTAITDALGHTTRFGYDARGNLTNVLNALGGQASFTRDTQGRVTSVTDFNGHTTAYDYTGGCSCGKPGTVTNPDGTVRRYEYNWLGQPTREVDELGHETVYHYDPHGILLWQEDAMQHRTSFGYVVNVTQTGLYPRLIAVTDPLNRTTRFDYDAMNRTNVITDAAGGVVQFEFDANGNRTQVTDPVGNVTRFVYDEANRLRHQVDPWGRTNFFSYDANGNRVEAIDRNGRRRTFGYDAMNRRTNEVWWEGETAVRTFTYTFNALGVMTGARDPASTLTFEFDPLNRLARSVQSGVEGLSDFTLTYAYDGMTNVVSVADNWGVQVASEYDSRNRLAKRIWRGGEIPGVSLSFAYNAAGNRTNILRFGDTAGSQLVGQSRYAYNPVGAMTEILHENGSGESLAQYHYGRDPAQQIIQRLLNAQATDYGYDVTGQLTTAVYTPPTQPDERYLYDANGNRVGGGYVVAHNNQIVADETFTYTYDLEGSMVGRSNTVTHATTTYNYDLRNRLMSMVDNDPSGPVSHTAEFTYDALNRRIVKNVNGTVTRFLLNQEDIWADGNGAEEIAARYLLGSRIDEMLARWWPQGEEVWYLTDNLGSVHDLADSAGTIVNHITYEAYGRILSQCETPTSDRVFFAGRELDRETQLYYNRGRYYSAQSGRFISQDPVGFSNSEWNLYKYAAGNPIVHTDPSGESVALEKRLIDYLVSGGVYGSVGALHGSLLGTLVYFGKCRLGGESYNAAAARDFFAQGAWIGWQVGAAIGISVVHGDISKWAAVYLLIQLPRDIAKLLSLPCQSE